MPTKTTSAWQGWMFAGVMLLIVGLCWFQMAVVWQRWSDGADTPDAAASLLDSVARSGGLLAAVATLLLAAVAISIPVILMAWSNVVDGIYSNACTAYTSCRKGGSDEGVNLVRAYRSLLQRASIASTLARRTLMLILGTSVILLLGLLIAQLAWQPDDVKLYQIVTVIYSVTMFLALLYIMVIIYMFYQKILNTKLDLQDQHLNFLAGGPALEPGADSKEKTMRPTKPEEVNIAAKPLSTAAMGALAGFGVLMFAVNILSGTLIVLGTGVPGAGGIVMFAFYAALAILARLLVPHRWAATLSSAVFGIVAIPFPVLGPPGFVFKVAITVCLGFFVDISFILLRRRPKIASYVAGLAVGYGGLAVILLLFYFFAPGAYQGFARWARNVFIWLNFVEGIAGAWIGWRLFLALRNHRVFQSLRSST